MLVKRVQKVGNSLAVFIPAEAAAQLNIREGDEVIMTIEPRSLTITPRHAADDEVREAFASFCVRFDAALRRLSE